MHMKKLLLASSALALLSGAQAAQAGDLYLSVFGGANFQSDSSAAIGVVTQTVEPDTGFVLGGAIGAPLDNWSKGLRAELEVSYRRNDLGGFWTDGGESGQIEGNMSTFAILANVLYECDFGWKVKPHVGAGIGWGHADADGAFVSYTSTFNMSESGFAWQLIAGFNYEATPGVNIGIDYHYFKGPEFSCFDDGGGECGFSVVENNSGDAGLESENHSVLFKVTVATN